MSPARAVTGKRRVQRRRLARSNSVSPVTGRPPSMPSWARRAASLRPRKPPPPKIAIFIGPPANGRTIAPPHEAVHRAAMLGPMPFRLFANPRCGKPVVDGAAGRRVPAGQGGDHRLERLRGDAAARSAGAREGPALRMRLKDEATRFGLGSFKALGGAYAVAMAAADRGRLRGGALGRPGGGSIRRPKLTVTCATDGNHGRAVAWGAQRFGCGCVIFVHAGVSQGRVDAIARYGARCAACPAPTTTRSARPRGRRRRMAGAWCPTPRGPATSMCRAGSCRATG